MQGEKAAGGQFIGKAEHILREAARRLLELADSLSLDENGATKTEKPFGAGLAGDGALGDVLVEVGATGENGAAVAPAGSKAREVGNESASSAAAPPAEGGKPVHEEERSRKNRISWNFE
jgi:hypothetical protein